MSNKNHDLDIRVLLNGKILDLTPRVLSEFKQFRIGQKIIPSLDEINDISITKDYIIVSKADKGFRDPTVSSVPLWKEEVLTENNIDAYDWDGNHVWNIADLLGPQRMSFWGGVVMTKEMVERSTNVILPEACEGHDLYGAHIGGSMYVIDLSDGNKIVAKVGNMK